MFHIQCQQLCIRVLQTAAGHLSTRFQPVATHADVFITSDYQAALQLLELPNVTDIFPSDAVARAKKYLGAIGTTGAYSESNGATVFREEIAAALKARRWRMFMPYLAAVATLTFEIALLVQPVSLYSHAVLWSLDS